MQASIPVDQFVAGPLMAVFTMKVDEELGKCTAEVALPHRNEAVQAFRFNGANKPFRMRIAVRGAERCPDDAHGGRLEQLSHRRTPPPMAFANQESLCAEHAVARIRELSHDLPHEGVHPDVVSSR